MRHIAEHKDSFRNTDIVGTKAPPALGDESTHAASLDRVEYHAGHGVGIVNHNGSKSNVHGRRSGFKECGKFGVWGV